MSPAPSAPAPLDFRSFLPQSAGRVFDSYEKLGELGEGGFGDVWLARERVRAATAEETAGRCVAIKRVRKPNSRAGLDEEEADSEDAVVDFRAEVELMKSLDHPSICRLLNVFEDAKSLYMVMEHIQGGELFDRIMALGSFGEHDAAQVLRQVASALSYCHARGVVHRDIKPENIMLVDAGEGEVLVKLIDFGFGCSVLRGARMKAQVGTFLYTAPESLTSETCDEKIDLWALGCLLFVLLSGNSPFFGTDVRERIVQARYSFDADEWADVSSEAKSLVQALLTVDPAARLSAREVLAHPWLAQSSPKSGAERLVLQRTMDAMKGYHQQSSLRHLYAGVLARQLDEGQLHELHMMFTQLDADEDGILSLGELRRLCENFGVAASDELQEMLKGIDMDGSGEIDYTEFIAACLDKRVKQQEDMCWTAFRVFDTDGSGRISKQELHAMVSGADLSGAFSTATLEQLWKELIGEDLQAAPQDHLDGEVDFDHFLAALGNVELAKVHQKLSSSEACPPEKPSLLSRGLPIAARRGAAPSLPILGRSKGDAASPSTGSTASATPTSAGLPIASRGAGGGLPIATRHG